MAVVEPAVPAGPAGLEEMYRDFAPPLVDLCRRRLGDAARAEDACHETLLRAQRAIGSFRPGAPMWPWLATIARNVCTDMQRRDARITLVAEPDDDACSPGPEEAAANNVRRELIADALTSLPANVRRSVYLRHIEGWSYEEIARADRTSLAAVRTRLTRGRRALRDRIEELARHRGEWPLPALAPLAWLRARAMRARLAVDRVDAGLGPALANAVPFAAALVIATGLGAGPPARPVPPAPAAPTAAAVAPVAAQPAVVAPVVAGAREPAGHEPSVAAPTPEAGAGRGGGSLPTTTPAMATTVPVGETAWSIEVGPVGLSCRQADGPVTQYLCPIVAPPSG